MISVRGQTLPQTGSRGLAALDRHIFQMRGRVKPFAKDILMAMPDSQSSAQIPVGADYNPKLEYGM